jgi:hypothetical protein
MSSIKALNGFLCLMLAVAMLSGRPCQGVTHELSGNQPGSGANLLSKQTRSEKTNKDIRQIVESQRSTIAESFIIVARDVETYALLQQQVGNLPEQSAEFFGSQAVVAVFLGQRPTSGFAIDITAEPDGHIRVRERRPPPNAMVKMVLTAPLKVVAIPVSSNEGLSFSLDETWKDKLRDYRLTTGEVTVTGGFAGTIKKLTLQGTIKVMQAGSWATFIFDLESSSGKTIRTLLDIASGKVDSSGNVVLKRVDSFALTGAIQSPFRAAGEFTNNEHDLNLHLETIGAPQISDNFTAQGSLTATAAVLRSKKPS